MNQDQIKIAEEGIEITKWLISIDELKLPIQLHQNFKYFRNVGKTFLKMFEISKTVDIPDGVFQRLGQFWDIYKVVTRNLKEQIDGVPSVAIAQLAASMQKSTQFSLQFISSDNLPTFPEIISYISALSDNVSGEAQLSQRIQTFDDLKIDTDRLLNEIRKYSSELSAEKFAELFGKQSLSYSRFWLRKAPVETSWFNYLKIGAAQLWLLGGVIILLSAIYWGIQTPVPDDLANTQKLIAFGLKKLFFLSIWIFSLRFCFRNYSHYKYLAIQNEHRQNILNSMQLLLQSISSTETAARTALLQEIAKNIYFGDKNPFLISQGKSDTDMKGMLEILKLLK